MRFAANKKAGAVACAIVLACVSTVALAKPYHVLHYLGGGDGKDPDRYPLTMDSAGNLYGAASYGGANGGGTIFKLAPDQTLTVLHSFGAGAGYSPNAGLALDGSGNLYGSTWGDTGTIFKLTPGGDYSVLFQFTSHDQFGRPGPLTFGADGNLYGETLWGSDNDTCTNGCGTIFRVTPDGDYSLVYTFTGGSDGCYPSGGLTADAAGNLYGTTLGQGPGSCPNWGTVFKVTPAGALTTLRTFRDVSQGTDLGGVTFDAAGNLYGAAQEGGFNQCDGDGLGCGVIYRLAPDGTFDALYKFHNAGDGGWPSLTPVLDQDGNLYGSTTYGTGMIYRLSPKGKMTILHSGTTSEWPNALLLRNGFLYGATRVNAYGKKHRGAIFRQVP